MEKPTETQVTNILHALKQFCVDHQVSIQGNMHVHTSPGNTHRLPDLIADPEGATVKDGDAVYATNAVSKA